MIFTQAILNGVYIIELQPAVDSRGWFIRTFCKNEFATIGHTDEWVQMNHSFTAKKGTIRGLHFQHSPYHEIKMVRCIAGAVLDVVVDLRKDSESFLQWMTVELSAANRKMIYIPKGFAHGFQTLEDNCELIYHHSATYVPNAEGGIKFNDPMLAIPWPLPVSTISERDMSHTYLTSNFKGL